jgi:hypothetical protein
MNKTNGISNSGSYTIRSESGFLYRILYSWTGKHMNNGEKIFALHNAVGLSGRRSAFDKGSLISENNLLSRLSASDLR